MSVHPDQKNLSSFSRNSNSLPPASQRQSSRRSGSSSSLKSLTSCPGNSRSGSTSSQHSSSHLPVSGFPQHHGLTSSLQDMQTSNFPNNFNSGSSSSLQSLQSSSPRPGSSPSHQSLNQNSTPNPSSGSSSVSNHQLQSAGCPMCLLHWENMCRQQATMQHQLCLQQQTIQQLNHTIHLLHLKIGQLEFNSNNQNQQLNEIIEIVKPTLHRDRPQTFPKNKTAKERELLASPKLSMEEKLMNKVQGVVSNNLRQDDTFRFFRHFCERRDVETTICDIKHLESEYERTNRCFTELKKMGKECFNPELIHKYFTDIGLKECADEIAQFLPSKKGAKSKQSESFPHASRSRGNGFITSTMDTLIVLKETRHNGHAAL